MSYSTRRSHHPAALHVATLPAITISALTWSCGPPLTRNSVPVCAILCQVEQICQSTNASLPRMVDVGPRVSHRADDEAAHSRRAPSCERAHRHAATREMSVPQQGRIRRRNREAFSHWSGRTKIHGIYEPFVVTIAEPICDSGREEPSNAIGESGYLRRPDSMHCHLR
jgi:hypothetical protein